MAGNTATLGTISSAYKSRAGSPKNGTATFSPNGSATAFTIAHGVGKVPTSKWVTPLNTLSGQHPVLTADSTSLTITYPTAPPAGSSTLALRWGAAGL